MSLSITGWDSLLRCTQVLESIVSYLPQNDLRNFHMASKAHWVYTNQAWARLRDQQFLGFEFSQNLSTDHRTRYIRAATLVRYITLRNTSNIDEILLAFKSVMEWFPPLGVWIQNDLSSLARRNIKIVENNNGTEGGDFLLNGLSELQKLNYEGAFTYFSKAIEKKGTYGSLWFVNFAKENHDYKFKLAYQSACQGDGRALEKLLSEDKNVSFLNYIEQGSDIIPYPSILAYKAKSKIDVDTPLAETLFDQAIQKYGSQVPFKVLVGAIVVKTQTKKWSEIDSLTDRVFRLYIKTDSLAFLCHAVIIKVLMKKFEEADRYFTLLWKQYKTRVPSSVLDLGVLIKFSLFKEDQAFELAKKIVKNYQNHQHIISWIWEVAANGKIKEEKWNLAEIYYDRILEMGQEFSSVLFTLAMVKERLGKSQESELLQARALLLKDSHESLEVLENHMQVKINLFAWRKVNKLYEDVLMAHGYKLPSKIIEMAAIAKLNINILPLEVSL